MAGWVCVPFDIRWKQHELKERIAISDPDVIVTERYKVNDLPGEEGRVIEIDEWKRMIEHYLPTYQSVKMYKMLLLHRIHIRINWKSKSILREQQSWVHSFDCNIHDFHMKEEDSILIAGTLVHSLFIRGNKCIIYRTNGAYYEKVYSKSSVG